MLISFTDPPSAPRITLDRSAGDATSEWNDVRLECAVADSGHPRAALRWAVNGRAVQAALGQGEEAEGEGTSRSVTASGMFAVVESSENFVLLYGQLCLHWSK